MATLTGSTQRVVALRISIVNVSIVNFSCRGMLSFNPHFSDNCNVTININTNLIKCYISLKKMLCCCVCNFGIINNISPCCSEIWSFAYPQKSYFTRASPSRNITSSGKQTVISPYNNGHKCIIANAIIRHLYTIDRIFFERKDETIL